MSKHIVLNWQGPLHWGTPEIETVPRCPGIYLWTIKKENQYYVYYIGESSNLIKRQAVHFSSLLGGEYKIFNPEKMEQGEFEVIYEKSSAAKQLSSFSQEIAFKAYENLRMSQLWYAALLDPVFADRTWRMPVESALITHLSNHSDCKKWITNNLSVHSHNSYKVRCESAFGIDLDVVGLSKHQLAIEYGQLDV